MKFFGQYPSPINMEEVQFNVLGLDVFPSSVYGGLKRAALKVSTHRSIGTGDVMREISRRGGRVASGGIADILNAGTVFNNDATPVLADLKEISALEDARRIIKILNDALLQDSLETPDPVLYVVEPLSLLDKAPNSTQILYEVYIRCFVGERNKE